eukprot:3697871-Rhodomonas_salina.1
MNQRVRGHRLPVDADGGAALACDSKPAHVPLVCCPVHVPVETQVGSALVGFQRACKVRWESEARLQRVAVELGLDDQKVDRRQRHRDRSEKAKGGWVAVADGSHAGGRRVGVPDVRSS